MDDALEHQKKSAQLASAFIKDHPTSGIKTPSDLYRHMQNNPGEVETWVQNKTDIPIEHRTVQELASAFQAAESLSQIHLPAPAQEEGTNKEQLGLAGALFSGFAPFLPDTNVKLAEYAMTQAAPDVNLYDFVPSEIKNDPDFQAELKQLRDTAIEDIRSEHRGRHLNNKQIEERLGELHRDFAKEAFEKYNGTADRAEKIRSARENDIYIKDANGRIVGEKVFKDKKNKINPTMDPVYLSYQAQKRAAVARALEKRKEDKKNGVKQKFSDEQLRTIVELEYDNHFAALFPEKAAAYAKADDNMKYSMKVMGKAEKKIQKRETKTAKQEKKKKTAHEYQDVWNKQKVSQAVLKGYDPFGLFKKIRDAKIWQARPWKTTDKNQPNKAVFKKNAQGETTVDAVKSTSRKVFETTPRSPRPTQAWSGYGSGGSSGNNFIWNRFFSNPIGKLNKQLGRKIGNRVFEKAASTVAKNVGKKLATQAAKQIAKRGAQEAATALLANPVSLVVIGIILLVLLVIMMIVVTLLKSGGGDSDFQLMGNTPPGGGAPGSSKNPIPGFTLTKAVDKSSSTYPEPITYTITFSYTPTSGATIQLSDITIYDKLPANVTYVESSGVSVFDSSTNTVSWKLSDAANTSPLTLKVTPNQDAIIINNSAYATAQAVTGGQPPSSSQPSSSDCGHYSLTSPLANYGDPNCNFTKDQLYTLLVSQDPQNADYWYAKIVPCESGYDPNAYLAASASGAGAYGLFQMNPTGRGNGEYDAGSVEWPTQISNAINYNSKVIGGSFNYWACK
ncbi:MAG: hypothetical protein ACM3IJ_01895 [Candidatus Levyibacteriota bacterium]